MAANRPLFITDFSLDDFDCSSGRMRIKFPATNNVSVLTQTVTSGNQIATHSPDGVVAATPIFETVTNLVDSGGGVITFTNEAGTAQPINICTVIGSCNVSALLNVNADTDAPVDCAIMSFDTTDNQWHAVDPSSALDCTLLVA